MPRRHKRWTPEEDDLLAEFYPRHGGAWSGWAKLMPDRLPTPNDIYKRMTRLKELDAQIDFDAERALDALPTAQVMRLRRLLKENEEDGHAEGD